MRAKVPCIQCHGKDSSCATCKGEGLKEDVVNHPKHYTFGKIEVIDAIEDWGLDKDFHLGNTIKYVARAKHKGNELQDLKKAQWYLSRKISKLEAALVRVR
jgi:hypothetical protein